LSRAFQRVGCAYRIELSPLERERLVRRQTATRREVFRAQIVLLAASGLRNDEVAERLGTFRESVSRWRKRYRGPFPSGGGRDQGPRLRPTG